MSRHAAARHEQAMDGMQNITIGTAVAGRNDLLAMHQRVRSDITDGTRRRLQNQR